MTNILGTKAETLERLRPILKSGEILPLFTFTTGQWKEDCGGLLKRLENEGWLDKLLIIRSSGAQEDSSSQSLAGHFDTVQNVMGADDVECAINSVFQSFGSTSIDNQIFIQPMLSNVKVSGVALTKDPSSNGHYYVINYDDSSGKTATVTSGKFNHPKTSYFDKSTPIENNHILYPVIKLLKELEQLLDNTSLDVEFALTEKEKLYLFQVRPLVLCGQAYLSTEDQKRVLGLVKEKYNAINKPHPYLYGLKTIFGVMPDWNPAEIIGKRPNPLALSFYKELITDSIWAYQRSNYGYKNLRSFPLLISFAGLPYIDVRVSFNSFLPKELGPALAEKLVNYYIEQFCKNPANHDKVEFNIIFSCYTLDLPERIKKLVEYGFGEKECVQLLKNLKSLTNRITKNNGLWKIDIEKISELEARQDEITKGDLDIISKIYWLLEDCKRYGTLPFAGLSRAAFVAVQLLKSMNNTKIISENDYDCFMMSLNTVGSQMTSDILKMSKINFQKKYGHLRPNTYNVLSPRYDEEPDRYFNWSCSKKVASDPTGNERKFSLSLDQKRKLDEMLIQHELEHDVVSIFKFLKGAIEGREYSKFVFTKSLSDMMSLFVKLGEEYGFSREDISFADINIIKEIYSASSHPKAAIEKSIQSGKEMYEATCQISLPSVISSENDIFFFNLQENEPNFITQNVATGTVVTKDYDYSKLRGVILFIPSADPGYDWIFSHGIVGFVTMYGGANSHMAIRAGEMGIPAVIGAGESLYQMWSEAKLLEVDCANKLVRILQ